MSRFIPKPVASLSNLPITELFDSIRDKFLHHNQLIVQAPTGSGKSTVLPLAMLDWPEIEGKILLLEPRRLAARMIARFLAKSLGEGVGQTIGLRVRGETKVSKQTRLEVVTEGVLTRLIQADPELDGVGLIVFDEVHERHLATDLALALALEVQSGLRDDLKVMLMSATLEGQPIETLLPEASLLKGEGRSFPVEIEYAAVPTNQPWLPALVAQVKRQLAKHDGNILVFLPGVGEIRKVLEQLEGHCPDNVDLCPLYGQLDSAAQDRAVMAPVEGRRKVVLSTNIAESSLTIDGISVVIDSGWQRRASFNLRSGQSKLELCRISQSSAAQRSGRAGRQMAGHCVRLWSESLQQGLAEADVAEIRRTDLLSLALELAAWGTTDIDSMSWLSPPPANAVTKARSLLQQLGLISPSHQITALGTRVHKLGADPRLGHMLVRSAELEADSDEQSYDGLTRLACDLAAILEEGDPLRGRDTGADIGRRLDAARRGRHKTMADKWWRQLGAKGQGQPAHHDLAGLLLALAFPDRVALRRGNEPRYRLSNGTGAVLEQHDPLASECSIVIAALNERAGHGDARVFLGASIDLSQLQQLEPGLFRQQRFAGLDSKGIMRAENQLRLGELVIEKTPLNDLTDEDYRVALLAQVQRQGLACLPWTDNARQLQTRIGLASKWLYDIQWPDLSDEVLLESIDSWLSPYLNGLTKMAQLEKLDLYQILLDQVPWEQRQVLDAELPQRIEVPTGSVMPLNYHRDGVKLAVRVQELYGQHESYRLARGQLPVTLELLSPARRPLQITEDLAAFWRGAWQDVKKEMKGRYPKHLWPDDPANTEPTRRTKRQQQSAKQ